MDDPNFEFLRELYPLYYKYCMKMDYFIFDGEYDEAALNSRKAVEGMVKNADKHFNPNTYVDYSITKGKKFLNHCDNLYDQGYCTDDIKDEIKYIWKNGGDSAHPTFRNFKREDLNLIAEKTHKILKYFFKEINPLYSISSIYKIITGDEEWIKERKGNSEDIKELNRQIEEKEKENLQIKTEMSDMENNLKNKESEIKNLKEKHEQELANLKREGFDNIEKYKAIMDEKEKNHLIQLKNLENKYDSLKEEYEAKERELSQEKDKLKAKVDNSDIYDIDDVGVFRNVKPVLEIKYPPMVLPEKSNADKASQLDFSQLAAVSSPSNRLVIDAGPGSGKTRVIIDRIEHLLNRNDPDSFLVITFTEKAANELKERLKEKLRADYGKADKIHVSTIHSFCRTLLRDNSSLEINILPEDNERIFIKETFKDKFSGASYIPPEEYEAVFGRFNEASMFDCNYERWIKWITNKFFKRQNDLKDDKTYIEFLESKGLGQEGFIFPESDVRNSKLYNKRWYANKYLAIAEAVKEYQEEILEKNSLYTFNRLQTAALEFLRENKDNLKIQYKNILIDEFQDTDAIQKEIFEILLENAETFTIVGDMDQSIYRWRGSNYKYLEEFANKPGFKMETLKKNYRSGRNLVEFNESFINRGDDEKSLESGKNESDGAVFYFDNESLDDQAEKVVKTIKYLHDKKDVKYSDIGLLFRSTRSHMVEHLIYKLKDEGINYTIKGNKDLDSKKYLEIRGILSLLWYITDSMPFYDLDQFLYLTDPFYKFSESTRNILINQRINPKRLSIMNRSELEMLGIDSFDLEFLLELNMLKKEFYSQSSVRNLYGISDGNVELEPYSFNPAINSAAESFENDEIIDIHFQTDDSRLTILGVYNKLLNISAYVDRQFMETDEDGYNDKNNYLLLNLGLISRIIKNYMKTVNKYDIEGLFKYLIQEYGNYSSPYNNKDKDDAVQILTVFKAKGLEFPVVFLCSLQKDTLPRPYFEKREDKNYNSKYVEFPIPDKFLTYKPHEKNEKAQHKAEERRVIYVANTRAKDLLIVSGVKKDYRISSPELRQIKEMAEELDVNKLNKQLKKLKISHTSEYKAFKKPSLSYSSFRDYTECKHKYDLRYNFEFEVDSSEKMELGTIVHDLLNKIHIKAKNEGEVDDEFIDEIFDNVYENNPFIIEGGYDNIIESIREYWEDYGQDWEIIASELPFTIKGEKYDFAGVIDLIVKEDPDVDEISIIDFKITEDELLDIESIKDKYENQLQIYAHALSIDPHFEKYDITNLKIFQIDGEDIYDDEENNFEIDEAQIDDLLNSLDKAVDEIYEGDFDKNLDRCRNCSYKDLCNVVL